MITYSIQKKREKTRNFAILEKLTKNGRKNGNDNKQFSEIYRPHCRQ